ncbi:Fc receptor-like protein 5 isoform X2 [Hyaena hyaena]|uniref:Fc receptor-like protein 5 isoform X2 n=1 Tax=Hyaena hyaena TaxID=95912 RepID=UPI001921D45D|nr:Fc receptor-like protein 5 isoform X2 [Hyaena hyaena]
MSSSGLLRRCAAPRSKPALFLLRKTLIWPQPRAGQAFMLLWVTVLVLEAASKPVISLHPPWTVVFKGETVTLTCNVFHFHAPEKRRRFLWYLGERKLHETSGNSLEVRDSGQYRCQTQDSLPSDHVSLTFSSANLILQGPPYVFEGDSVVLRCRANAELALNATTLYRRGEVLRLSTESSHFHIKDAGLKDNGDYHCSGFKNDYSYSSNTINIQVQELFPRPVLTARPSWSIIGKSVTLTCETQLPPQRSDVKLWFYFFQDGQKLEVSLKNFLKTSTTTMRGQKPQYYWCEARRGSSGVCKQSQKVQLHVPIPVSRPILTLSPPGATVPEGHTVTLSCKAERGSFPILYQFLREEVVIGKMEATQGTKSFMSLKAKHSGNYYCTADNGLGPQRSPPVYLTVIVPASRPVLTVRKPRAQAVEGDKAELHCEAPRGSPPILYRFYHEGDALGSSWDYHGGGGSLTLHLTAEHSGEYACEADNGLGAQRSEAVPLSVTVPASRPVLTVRKPRAQAVEGDKAELHCEAPRGSPPILYRFYHEGDALGSSWDYHGGGGSLTLHLTAEHSGEYACEADNGLGAQRSEAVPLSVTVPASRPVLTVRKPRAQAVEGDKVELHCESPRGSPPILYRFYHQGDALGSSSAPSGGGASFNLSLTAEHSGNYSCEADNGLGAQCSEAVSLSIIVPVSCPALTLKVPRAQVQVGDVVELRCEAQRGSPPILYQFYREDIPVGNNSAPSGGGASFNLSLTTEHSGNYSCEADNGLGARRSEAVLLSISGPAGSISGLVATGVTGGLFSALSFGVVALLLYCRLLRKAGGRPTSDPSRSPSDSDVREPTYHNVPAWMELQPVYSNVNHRGGEVVYSEVRRGPQGDRPAANSESALGLLWTHLPSRCQAAGYWPPDPQGSSVIYSQVKVVCPPVSAAPRS